MTRPSSPGRSEMLAEIQTARVQASLYDTDTAEPYVSLALPHGCTFGGRWWEPGGSLKLSFSQLTVPEGLRREGIATRLISALTHIALTSELATRQYGGSVESPYVLRTLARLFGRERVEIRDYRSPFPELTYDQAVDFLAPALDEEGVIVAIRFAGLDAKDFEKPEIVADLP